MNSAASRPEPWPPRLTMNEYADFVWELMRDGDPALMARQKALEEQITQPFRLPPAARQANQ